MSRVTPRGTPAPSAEAEARRAAEAERANLLRLLAQAPAAVAIVRGPDHVFVLSNALNQRLTGGRPLLGRPAREALPELAAQGMVELLDRVYREGEPHVVAETAARLPTPEGGEREAFLAFTYQPLRGPDGAVEGVMAFAYEVTEQVRARRHAEELAGQLLLEKERLAASEARYREMLETAQEGVWLLDQRGVTTYVNRRQAEMLGRSVGDMVGRPLQDFVDDDARAEVEHFLARRRWDSSERHDVRFTHRDGRDVWTIVATSPLLDEAGRPAGFLGMVTDVTERRLDGERSRVLNEVGRALGSSTDVREMAAAVARALVSGGFAPACSVRLEDGGDGRPFEASALEELVRAGPRRAPRGRPTPPAMLSVPLVAGGKVIGTIVVGPRRQRPFVEGDVAWARDLASRVAVALDNARLFAESQRARRHAEEAARAKDEFLAVISHELRTPLNAMLGWATMLRAGELDGADRDRALAVVERSARAQARLIEDLLDVSRVVSGKLRIDPGPLDLAAVVVAAVDTVRPAAEAKGVDLALEAPAGEAPCHGDASRLQQVVWNLASNAVKFTPPGGRVRVALARDGAHWRLRVEDSGRGIAPDFLPHVFERFRQQDGSTTRAQGGLGLGLAIVKSLVELHGGTASAESEGEGRGATFVVRVPAAPAASAAPRPRASLPSGGELDAYRAGLAGLRVVVVDDDGDARELLGALLGRAAVDVRPAASAEEALRLVRELRPDALVSDVGMPGEDGYALVRRLRALPPAEGGATPALALTAYAGPDDRRRALDAGFSAHLSKPVDPAELFVALAAIARPDSP